MFINADQIVTATDRILLGNITKRRATSDLTVAARLAVARSHANEEATVYVRGRSVSKPQLALLVAASFAWLAVVAVRLLA